MDLRAISFTEDRSNWNYPTLLEFILKIAAVGLYLLPFISIALILGYSFKKNFKRLKIVVFVSAALFIIFSIMASYAIWGH
jgi:hypothetical protein